MAAQDSVLVQIARPYAQALYDIAQGDGSVEQVEQGIAGQTAEPRGTIRLSAPLSFAMAHLGCLLPLFLQRHPQVSVEVDLSDRPVDLIGEGYDLALLKFLVPCALIGVLLGFVLFRVMDAQLVAGLVGINSLLQVLFFSVYAYFYLEIMLPLFGFDGMTIDISMVKCCDAIFQTGFNHLQIFSC